MKQKCVWLIGGTQDSVAIANLLTTRQIPLVVSVVSNSARKLYSERVRVVVGCMAQETMESFCQQEPISAIIDASHPFAVEVSKQAIAVAAALNLPYLRYEREQCTSSNANSDNGLILELDSFTTLVSGNYLEGHRVLLTVGCKTLDLFRPWQHRATLYARILPQPTSLAIALAAGFESDRLIAIRPPISQELEKALWQQWQISLVVTKASGKPGGEAIKRQLARELNLPLITISRPQLSYPQQTSSLAEIIDFLS